MGFLKHTFEIVLLEWNKHQYHHKTPSNSSNSLIFMRPLVKVAS